MDVYDYSDYRAYLRAVCDQTQAKGQLTRLAKAAECQLSYLSRVLSEQVHITRDHAFGISMELQHSEDEEKYFMDLVDLGRAANPQYRSHLTQKLSRMKKEKEDSQKKGPRENLEYSARELIYNSAWYYSAIHLLTSAPEYQSVEALINKTRLSKATVTRVLQDLLTMGYVENKGRTWIYLSGEGHLNQNSHLTLLHHQNWRLKSIEEMKSFTESNLHYALAQTVSKADFEKIRKILLGSIASVTKVAGPSEPEELLCFTLDCFKL